MADLSKVIYINEDDYSTLLNGGTITKDGVTYNYDVTALYVIKDISAPEYAEEAGYAYSAGTAGTASALDSPPVFNTVSGGKIQVTVGGQTSAGYTVPFATDATNATNDSYGNNIAQTYNKKPLVIELDYDSMDTSLGGQVPQGTYNSITTAIGQGKDVIVKLTSDDCNFDTYFRLSQDNADESWYTFYAGTNQDNTEIVSLDISSGDYCNLYTGIFVTGNISTNGYFAGLLKPNVIQSGASILSYANQPLATTQSAQTDDTKPITAKNAFEYVKSSILDLPYSIIAEKTFDPYTISASDIDNGYIFFLNVVPTSDNYYEPWKIKYRLSITTENQYIQGIYDCEMGSAGTSQQYSIFNRFYSTSYYPSYLHLMAWHSTAAKYANRSTNPIKIGERIWSAASATTVARTFTIQVIETKNCTVSFPDDIETYGDVYTDAKYGYCTEFNATSVGLQETGDTSYPNYYNYEYSESYKIHSVETPLYRYKYCGLDEKGRLIPITNTNQTNATIVTKIPTSVPMVVSKGLVYYGNTTTISDISTNVATGVIYRSHAMSNPLVYNFNTGIVANTDVYLVGSYDPETDLFTLDSTSTNSYYLYASNTDASTYLSNFTQGKYYWLLGNTTASYINFLIDNPLMYFDGTNLISADAASYNTLKDYVDTQIGALPNPMIFKGSVGTGGTIEWANLPSASLSNEGWTYKVITSHDTSPVCGVGDTIISNGSDWVVIPSGDEPSGTVTSVAASGDTTISISGSPITTSGTLSITHNTSGATAGSYGDSSAQTPGYGDTFKVPYVTVDVKGHVTGISEHNVTIPAAGYCANLGVTTAATYNTQPEFKEVKINGSTTNAASSDNCVMQYDTTNKCVKFVFNS